MQHLNPMGVLHIAGFITVCEAFLGMEPHVDFFRRLFSKRTMMAGSSTETASVDGFALQRKPSAGGSYPTYIPYDSNRGWHGEWFYIRNLAATPFLAFTGRRLEKRDSWLWGCAHKEKHKVGVIEEELWKLVKHGLDGVRVFHTLYHRWVAPLVERTRPMWMYNGPSDLDHASPEDLPDDKVWSRLGSVL